MRKSLSVVWKILLGLITILVIAFLFLNLDRVAPQFFWKRYKSQEYGFTIQYPITYNIQAESVNGDSQLYIGDPLTNFGKGLSNGNALRPHDTFWSAQHSQLLLQLQKLATENAPATALASSTYEYLGKINIDGKIGYQFLSDGFLGVQKTTVFPNDDGSVFIIDAMIWDRPHSNDFSVPAPLQPYDSIVNTIKFNY